MALNAKAKGSPIEFVFPSEGVPAVTEPVAIMATAKNVDGAKKFLADIKTEKLEPFADPTAKEGLRLKVIGMPTTILIDAEGREIGRLIGPAHWDSPEAKKLIEAQLK